MHRKGVKISALGKKGLKVKALMKGVEGKVNGWATESSEGNKRLSV